MSAQSERTLWEGAVTHIAACGKVLKAAVDGQDATASKRTPSLANATYHARAALIEAEDYEREQYEAMRAAQREESAGDPDQMALDLNAEAAPPDYSPVVEFQNEQAFAVLFRVNTDRPIRLEPGERIEYPNGADVSWTAAEAEAPADDTPAAVEAT